MSGYLIFLVKDEKNLFLRKVVDNQKITCYYIRAVRKTGQHIEN